MKQFTALAASWMKESDRYKDQVEEARAKNLPHEQMLSYMHCLRMCARDVESLVRKTQQCECDITQTCAVCSPKVAAERPIC